MSETSEDMAAMEQQRAVAETRVLPPQATISVPSAPLVDEHEPAIYRCPELSKAVATARDHCKMAAKDGWNDYHKFKYSTADGVIETAKEALAFTGVAIIPHKQKMSILMVGNTAIYALDRTWLLCHSSGECVPMVLEGWPVIPEKGRPLDKALAVALTTSLSYLLRDLLQMPRGDEAEMNARDDRPKQQAPAKPAPAQTTEQRKNASAEKPDRSYLRNELFSLLEQISELEDVHVDTLQNAACKAAKVSKLDEMDDATLRDIVLGARSRLAKAKTAPARA